MQDEQQSIVTAADHMAGFKDVTVTFRSGETDVIRIVAPNRKQTRELPGAISKAGGFDPVFKVCLAQPQSAVGMLRDASLFLDRLTMESANEVELVCLTLTFGDEWFKKKFLPMREKFRTLLESIEAKLFAAEVISSNGKSTDGATPSSPLSSDS